MASKQPKHNIMKNTSTLPTDSDGINEQDKRLNKPSVSTTQPTGIKLYQLNQYELEMVSKGSYESLFLNFGIALISICFASFSTLLTADFPKEKVKVYITFLCVTIMTFISGIILFILWIKEKKSFILDKEEIKNRTLIPNE